MQLNDFWSNLITIIIRSTLLEVSPSLALLKDY